MEGLGSVNRARWRTACRAEPWWRESTAAVSEVASWSASVGDSDTAILSVEWGAVGSVQHSHSGPLVASRSHLRCCHSASQQQQRLPAIVHHLPALRRQPHASCTAIVAALPERPLTLTHSHSLVMAEHSFATSSVLPSTPPEPPPAAPIGALQASRVRHLLPLLSRYPICTFCLLRLCNVRSPDAYTSHPLPSLRQQLLALCPQLPSQSPAVCFTCLNVLAGLRDRMAEVVAAERYAQYDFSSLWFTLSLPVTLMLRHVALSSHLLASHPQLSNDTTTLPIAEVKDIVRVLLAQTLPSLISTPLLPAASASPHSIELQLLWSFPTTANEERLMERHTREIERRQRKKRYKASDVMTVNNVLQAIPHITAQQATTLLHSYFRQSAAATDEAKIETDSAMLQLACSEAAVLTFQLYRSPVLLMGSYIKHSRAISQTPWTIDGDDSPPAAASPTTDSTAAAASAALVRPKSRITATSVEEELTCHLLPHFVCSSHRFSSSGREDLDVRMLGEGRTFVLEIIDAKRVPAEDDATVWMAMERAVNSGSESVDVRGVRLCSKAEFAAMKAGVETKCKRYRAIVHAMDALSEARLAPLRALTFPLIVQQRTPIRVLHRRSALTRVKVLHSVEWSVINAHWLQIDIVTSAGMYVKEWVHGDRGRTVPSLSSLLGTLCECVQLDVTALLHDAQAGAADGDRVTTDAEELKSE